MSTINTTPNLHLPQWTSDEKPMWLTDMNQAFSSIDMGYGLHTGDITDLKAQIANEIVDRQQLAQRVSNNEVAIVNLNNAMDQTQNDLVNMLEVKSKNLTLTFGGDDSEKVTVNSATMVYNAFMARFRIALRLHGVISSAINGTLDGVVGQTSQDTNIAMPTAWVCRPTTDNSFGALVSANLYPSTWTFSIFATSQLDYDKIQSDIVFSAAVPVKTYNPATRMVMVPEIPDVLYLSVHDLR